MPFEPFSFLQSRSWPDDFFRELLEQSGRFPQRTAGVFPPVNIFDDGEAFLVRAEVPGLNKQSLEVTVKNDQLTLRGERVVAPAGSSANYHRREREGGTFRRVVTLPHRVDADHIRATYKQGVLEVVLPRVAEAKERRIEVH